MSRCPVHRVAKLLIQGQEVLDIHARECGDRVLAFGLSLPDHDALSVCELWGIPVLGSESIGEGRLQLICEADSVLIPPFETVEDIDEVLRWQPAGARRPARPKVSPRTS